MGIHHEDAVPQSKKWFEIRKQLGALTASVVGNAVGINSEDRTAKGLKQIVKQWEYTRDPSKNTFAGNFFTRRGNFYEPLCFKVFEAAIGIPVQPCSIWQSEKWPWLYATPDGLIDKDTGLEVKNPYSHMHKAPPPHYMAQMQVQMHCSDRIRTYFMSQCLEEDRARIWMVDYSQTYMGWLMPQLEHFHNTAVDPEGKLDLSLFDMTPPYVPFELLKEVESVVDLVGPYEKFPEQNPYARKQPAPTKRFEPPADYVETAVKRKLTRKDLPTEIDDDFFS